jgi:hypothetical protein
MESQIFLPRKFASVIDHFKGFKNILYNYITPLGLANLGDVTQV